MGQRDRAVAVVGAGLRLPGGITDLAGLWAALAEGRDLVGEIPADRFDRTRFVDPGAVRAGRSYTGAGGFLDDVACFDPGYFGIAPKEAPYVDPQQRLLLEMTAEALDDAGIPAESLAGSDTCVYIGVSDPAYGQFIMTQENHTSPYAMSGSTLSIAANRLSYCFDLRGPSMAVDTACSSALVALDRACRTLLDGTSRTALAGGVNVLIGPYAFAGFSHAGMLSRRGRCAAFSAGADGFVRSEGGGVVVLKRLADALSDGDRIHAVIAGTGTNCDGRTQGMALPSSHAQEALLRAVYERAGVEPDDLVYFEAHGTGTPAGDPAEAAAIGRALGQRRTRGPLPIGSVKSNVGHLEPAAGMPSLLKALLVLRHGTAPATLHAHPLNPAIDFAGLGLAPTVESVGLCLGERAAVGVNSFGFGGANAHAVLIPPPAPPDHHRPHTGGTLPVVVSARSAAALRELTGRVSARLREAAPEEFYDLARTTTLRRSAHPHRAAVLADGPERAAEEFDRLLAGTPATGALARAADRRTVAYVFSGNASQWPGMAADLLAADVVFRAAVEEADAALAPHLGWSVARELAGPDAAAWRRTEIAQPVLFAVQIGLAALFAARGLRPSAVTGHSVGEVAAAHVAGALPLDDAARVIAERSRAQGVTAGAGRMAAVGLSEAEALGALARYEGALELAGINSDRDVTVAGDPRALADLGAELNARDVFFRELGLDYAFHSRAMDPIADPLRAALAGLAPAPVRVPFVSAVTGTPLPGDALTPDYWWRNVREPVRFAAAVAHVVAEHAGILVEIGPHPVLRPYLRRTGASYVPTLRRDGDGPREAAAAVAGLIATGAVVDWPTHFPAPGRVADLPPYPWQRERYWHGAPQDMVVRTSGTGLLDHPLLGERLPAPHALWEGTVEPQLAPWLGDHRIARTVLMPAAGYLEMALSAGRLALGRPVEVRHLQIFRPLALGWPDPEGVRLQTAVTPADGALTISSSQGRGGACEPVVRAEVRTLLGAAPAPLDPEALRARCPRTVAAADFYRTCHRVGLGVGPAFQLLGEVHVGEGELLASYRHEEPGAPYTVHPVVLDGPLQATVALVERWMDSGRAYLPSVFGAVRVWRTPAPTGFVHLRQRARTENEFCWDIAYADEDGTVSAQIEGCRTRRMDNSDHTPVTVQRTVLRAAPLPLSPAASSPLPPPADLLAAVEDRMSAARAALRESGHDRCAAAAEEAGAHCWAAALAGLLTDPAATFAAGDLVAGGLRPQHRRLVRLMLPLVARHGLAELMDNERWRLTRTVPRPGELLRKLVEDHPACAAETVLINRQLRHLPDVLRGASEAAELLPPGDPVLEQLHATAPARRFAHRVVMALVTEAVRQWPGDRPLRVLEAGAGTHALTAALLPLLPADRTRFTCTDATATGFARAEHRFVDYDFVEYRLLALDRDPLSQGFPDGGFDLVVAGDALHTATDLTAALGHVRTLLSPGGLLLSTEPHDVWRTAFVLGATEAFWQRGDHALRPETRLLAREKWLPLLATCGFTGAVRTGIEDRSVLLASADRLPADGPAPPTPEPGAAWLVVTETSDEVPLARALAELLGQADVVATPEDPAAWDAALPSGGVPPGVVLLLATDACAEVVALTTRRAAVLRALSAARSGAIGGVWLVTRPSGLFPAPERPAHPADAAVWGAARVLANEHPGLSLRRISLDRSDAPATGARRLAHELLAPGAEDEIVLTRNGRFVPRQLQRPADRPDPAPGHTPYVLEVRDPGLSRRLVWRRTEPLRPGPGEILVEVRAVGLNYRDPMRANGLLPPEAVEGSPLSRGLGTDCAGIVRATGPGVTTFTPGDRVLGPMPASLASHTVTPAATSLRVPDGMSYAEAATFPVAFLTVHHTLAEQARTFPGETVLVHGGAGAVGLTVLQSARHLGLHVIATAGTEAKRDLLHTLGAAHVLDSRSLDFVPRVRELTGGRGVDIVVNSLSGEAIAHGLDLLRPNGRFIELGKRDIFLNNPLLLRPFHHSLTFLGFNLDSVMFDPQRCPPLLRDVAERIVRGAYRPLLHTVHPAARVDEAFRLLQHSQHTGKVVVAFDPLDEPVPVESPSAIPLLDPDGTYLVTGGLGGFGAATATWLADRGARHLALVSRRGANAPEATEILAHLAERGADATAYAADVTDETAMRQVITAVDATGHRLRGIAHCAMHLDDAPLADLTDERFAAVLAPKIAGADVLAHLTADRDPDVDLFLLYSSVAASIGNPGQAPYAAANAYVEALARARRHAGRAGSAIAWGPISETGYVARNDLGATMAHLGFEPAAPAEAFAAADHLVATGTDVSGVGRYRWGRARRVLPALAAPRYAALVPAGAAESDDTREEFLRHLAALSPEETAHAVTEALTHLLATVLRADPTELDADRRLEEFGLDSLMSTEFLLHTRERFGVQLSPTELIGGPRTLTQFARLVHERLGTHTAG
ncbi:type I polyketide synthase [Streptomyces netropsis]|uniref:Acyl transferase domain-containing protein/NADPH:quinone reductase-like Zn-dependent oxidoreductase/acyl carrier protein n=1 Tax=Streptomyces netropsis TaxID=55404 RepID=A0A7W7PGM5_STRNE|nr:type I polyketide synthase [Streptomyces netropsis]MBB4887900.1 acyl transferase domain-containing protein/NADPH:quinone reductase-like Zn-dependent oxidoreductase/acyl carrier protein [Streptomyces netropsis]GGR52101.1 type I polyketide synthase [Streptomyces netropsis]